MSTFTLTTQHIALLRGMYVSMDCGSPAIDAKRPYGNSGWSRYTDMDRLLGYPYKVDVETLEDHPEIMEALDKLHAETETALQIVLATGTFIPGTYRQERMYHELSWKLCDNSGESSE